MKRVIKTILVSAMAMSFVLGAASCSLFDSAAKDCQKVGDEFVQNLLDRSMDDCVDACIDEDDAAGLLTFSEDFSSDEYNDCIAAIFEKTTFKVDKKSVDCSTKDEEGTIDYIVTLPDYESVADDEPEDADEFCDMIAECEDTIEMTITLEFELDDDEWFISNPGDVVEDFCAEINSTQFYESIVLDGILSSEYSQYIDHLTWWTASDGCLELDMVTNEEGYSVEFEFYFTVICDGSLIYTSDELSDQGTYIEAYFYPSYIGLEEFEDGSYTTIFYTLSGAPIAASSYVLD